MVVNWKQVVTILLPLIFVPVSIAWALLSLHAKHPHDNAVHRREFEILQEDWKLEVRDLKEEIRELRRDFKDAQRDK
jgi:hypothetical protein